MQKGETTYNEFAQKSMDQLDPADFKNGILYDKVYPLAGLNIFNQTDSRKDTSDVNHFLQAWHELYTASNNPSFIEAKLAKELAFHFEMKNIVQIGLINVDFTVLDSTSLNPKKGSLTVKENKLVKTVGKNPYLNKQALVVAPLVSTVSSDNGEVTFNFGVVELEKSTNPIATMDMYVENGKKITIIDNGKRVLNEATVALKTGGIKTIRFKVCYKNNKTIATYGRFNVEFLQNTEKTKSALATQSMGGISPTYTITATSPFIGYNETGSCDGTCYGKGEYKIYYGNSGNKILKPFIIVDGYDPGDTRKIESLNLDNSIYTGALRIDNVNSKLFGDELRIKGYDVIILSFPNYKIRTKFILGIPIDVYRDGGADYIERNAKVLEALITSVNSSLTANGSNEELVVAGPSMGALVTQYALVEMENNNIDHNTRLWVSFDGPHKGANIAIGFQGIISYTGILESKIDNPAAKQMLIDHYLAGNSHGLATGAPGFRDRFQNLINSMGFPQQTRNIAVLNGSLMGTQQGIPANRIVRGEAVSGILATGLTLFQATKAVCNVFYTPNSGNSRVFEFRVEAFWGLYNSINVNYYSSSLSSKGSIDCSPGGNFDLYGRIGNIVIPNFGSGFFGTAGNVAFSILYFSANVQIYGNFAFIPLKSALAYSGSNTLWLEKLGNRNLVCSGETPFDSYYGPNHNQEHSSVHTDGVAWLMQELDGNLMPPSTYFNENDLTGGNTLCLNSTKSYSFSTCKLPSNVVWTVSPNIQKVSSSGNQIIVKGLYGGVGWIKAKVHSGSYSITLLDAVVNVFPSVTGTISQNGQSSPLYEYMNMVHTNEWVGININCPGASSVNWNLKTSGGNPYWSAYGYGSSSYLELFFPSSSGYADFDLTLSSSSCGTTTKNYIFYPDYSYYSYSMSPNPVINEITINRFEPGVDVNQEIILEPWQRKGEVKVNENLSGVDNMGILKSVDIMKKKPINEDFQIEIYNINGSKLKSFEGNGNTTTVNLQGLPPGAYFLQIVTPTEIYKEKIIKQR